MENKEQRVNETLQAASAAFWAVVARNFPEAKHGDFPPEMQFQLDQTMEKSIRVWLDYNAQELK
jgi:hypothetical protein